MYKVLLVDDERVIREGISTIVDWNSLNICIDTAASGAEAWEKITVAPPDIVITDIKMPGMNGLELIDKVKNRYPAIYFVILSAYGEFDFANKAMKYGIKHYILKPCNEDEILDVMKNVIDDIENQKEVEFVLSRVNKDNAIKNSITIRDIDDYITNYKKIHPLIKEALKNIALNVGNEQFYLTYLAEQILYVNPDYLGKLFKKEVGENFSCFLARIRIEQAKKFMLSKPNASINEIACKVGFGDNPQYFSQVFKKFTDMTPSEYKKSIKTP
ncbi:response regulator [Mahella sp.]|uniref:response regulator transcription factor n=1 Tax=Mahella sp. TaxID=2798721 RepID=UPI0025BE3F0D|nr:response regulator [Mahella sp.]MBZ4665183.1 two component transcriptional regulator, AraC family [Mahella sp.]